MTDESAEFAGLIFDLDGTLVDTAAINQASLTATFAAFGCAAGHDVVHSGSAFVDRVRLMREAGLIPPSIDDTRLSAECERQILSRIDDVCPLEPVIEIVRAARGRVRLALATSNTRPVASRLLAAIGLSDTFDVVVTREDVARGKPAPDSFLRAARLLGLAPEQCLVYEDSPIGLEAAHTAGMRAVDVRPLIRAAAG